MKIKKLNRIAVSVIIVNYKVKKELFDCVNSIIKSSPKITYEVIIIDNDVENEIENDLLNKFPNVKYIKSPSNIGYGGGNNLGSKFAKGEYLFFLNPDTKVLDDALDNLYNFTKNSSVGIASPIFLDSNLKPFKSQGSEELTPKNIIFSQSLLKRIFPNKNIYNKNVLVGWDIKSPLSVNAIPGGAMMIGSNLFKKIGGFDENLFLYFEENDISKKVNNLGYKLFIVPTAKIIHLVGRSTRNLKNMEDIYSKSRYYYLKKHYGLFRAISTQALLSINKTSLFLLLILILAFFLRVVNIENTMPFIGDQGWFYLSARDMHINGQIPLVGIASSHPWLHQGPLWTYMLAGVFWLLGFNPLNGAYLTIILGSLSVLMVYVVGSDMFSKRIGLISTLLYATSPLAVVHSRTPYHTSPIPLFTLLFIYALYKWIKGNNIYFPLSILFLAILYNLELATSTLWGVLIAVLIYGIWKKKGWVKKLFNKKILIYSILAFAIPMLPVLIYDFFHGFPQTLKFGIWIIYRILRFFGFPGIHEGDQLTEANSIISFSFSFYQNLIFAENKIIAFVILLFSIVVFIFNIFRLISKKISGVGFLLLALWLLISFSGYYINQTSSEAYLPIFFPALIFLTAFSFDKILKIRLLYFPAIIIIMIIVLMNSFYIISTEYSDRKYNFSKRLFIVKRVVEDAGGRSYNIVGKGEGSKFESFTMNYEYLAWWLGNAPSKSSQKLKFVIQENIDGISLIKNE